MTSTQYPSSAEGIRRSDFYLQDWYYSIELVPGLFTRGLNLRNIGLTRRLLSDCDVKGRRCLDLGTMEAAVPVLLSRRGASAVVAADRFDCRERIDAVRHYTGTSFDYFSGLTHQQTAPFLADRGLLNFDLVVLSGVLYHLWSPMDALAMARSLVRTGGLMLVESAATLEEEPAMFFNSAGRFSADPTTFFLPSARLLEYVLRHFELAPLACVYGEVNDLSGHKTGRVAILCRALDEVPAGGDEWMVAAGKVVGFMSKELPWSKLERGGQDPVPFATQVPRVTDESTGYCDVVRTILTTTPLPLPDEVTKIRLDDLD